MKELICAEKNVQDYNYYDSQLVKRFITYFYLSMAMITIWAVGVLFTIDNLIINGLI